MNSECEGGNPGERVRAGHPRVIRESAFDQNAGRRIVENLAQTLYEASDHSGTPWARRGRPIRDAWIAAATDQLSSPPGRLP